MKFRKLGKNGPEISALGVGAMSFANFYGATTDDKSQTILAATLDAGVTHIDTSNVYGMGRSETQIGVFLSDNPNARDQFHIATKAGITKDEDGNRCFRNTYEHFEAELDKSLLKVGTDHVDLFYAHRRQPDMPIEEAAGNLKRLVETGKTRAVGFSEIAPTSLRRAATECHIDAVQSEYSLSVRSPELGLVQACAELGTALVAFSPVGRSFLTDNPLTAANVKEAGGWVAANPRFQEPNYSANIAATDRLRVYAA
ncbi:MAG: aldo/keto reductase, partial [Paracoccaceae bacterium]|nr:aldo/keto reductase [Paracoccaceae bacterium]